MMGKIIFSIIFIPLNALILWVINSFMTERESYRKALLAGVLFFLISLLELITLKGFYLSILGNFLAGGTVSIVLSFFVIWWLYKYDFWSLILMWGIWNILQIPFNILQNKILNLPWDTMLRCF